MMSVHRTARHLLLSAGGLMAVLALAVYLVVRGAPRVVPTVPVGTARAQAAALAAVGGGQLLMSEATVHHGPPLYAFAIRPSARGAADKGLAAAATPVQVLVSPASGRVVAVIPQPAASPSGSGPAIVPSGSGGPISAATAQAIAVRAVGGGQALATTRTEPTDQGTWSYRVQVLEPTSARVDVTVSPTGRVLGVRAGVDR